MSERDPNDVPRASIEPYKITPMERYVEPVPPPPDTPAPNFFQESVLALKALTRELGEAIRESRSTRK